MDLFNVYVTVLIVFRNNMARENPISESLVELVCSLTFVSH